MSSRHERRYAAVVFDLGGVVTDSPLHAIADYERDHGLTVGSINRAIADYDSKTGVLTYEQVEDVSDVVNSNLESQKDPQNGFTQERMFRHVGEIPTSAWHPYARKIGYYQMDADQKRIAMWKFLMDNPQYCVVDKRKHDTAHQGHVIIK